MALLVLKWSRLNRRWSQLGNKWSGLGERRSGHGKSGPDCEKMSGCTKKIQNEQ